MHLPRLPRKAEDAGGAREVFDAGGAGFAEVAPFRVTARSVESLKCFERRDADHAVSAGFAPVEVAATIVQVVELVA